MRYPGWQSLFFSCVLWLTTGSDLLPFSSPEDGVIKACTGQRIDLYAPQLTNAGLTALVSCGVEAIPQLLEALKSQDWKVKVIAAHTLGLFGAKAQPAIPALSNLIQDENANVRFAAAQALGEINSEQAISSLIEALQDKDENVRFAATDTLLELGSKVQQNNLLTFVKILTNGNQSPVYSEFTITDTLKPESRLAIPAYIEALGNSNWFIRNQAADALTKLKVDSISIPNNTLRVGSNNMPNGYVRGVFTDTFLRTNSAYPIEILKSSKDAEIRRQAAQVLGMLGSEKVVPSLINALQDKNPNVRIEAVKALGRIGAEEAVPALVTTWQEASSRKDRYIFEGGGYVDANSVALDVRQAVIRASEQIGSQEALSALITAFPRDKRSFVAFSTARKIAKGETTTEESIALLSSILQSGDIGAIARIINPPEFVSNNHAYLSALKTSLQQLGIENVVSILRPTLLLEAENEYDSTTTYNRFAAAKVLSVFGADVVPVIVKSFSEAEAFSIFTDVLPMADEDFPTQDIAKNVLNRVSAKIIPNLIAILQDTKSDERSNAAEALGNSRSEEAVPFLIESLTSPNKSLKREAITALGKIGSAEAVPALTRTLKDKQSYIRSWSAISLGKIGSTKAVPYLIETLQRDSNESVRHFVAEALGKIGSSEAVLILIASLKDESYSVREAAAEALGQIKAKAAIPALIESLKDKNWTVRLKAAAALKSIGAESLPPLIKILNSNRDNSSALRTALKDKNADHRRSAAYVLWEMGPLASEAKDELMAVVMDESDNLYVQWMAAAALEQMGQDMEQFFQKNNLINPKNLTPAKCPNDLYNAELDSKATTPDFFEEKTVDTNELVYAGRCIYGDLAQGGGTLYGFYERLKALLNRR